MRLTWVRVRAGEYETVPRRGALTRQRRSQAWMFSRWRAGSWTGHRRLGTDLALAQRLAEEILA